MCATRYAIMMLRYASTTRAYHNFRRKLVYPKGGWLNRMRKFVTWTAIKNEYGTGSWSLDGDLLTVVTQHG